ncbi:MAG TPA: M28 family peptidase, partial [Pyrinomonadaceae bacterium]|nr:M28 family peptidase [Pyrinomonadaceae bacterium]
MRRKLFSTIFALALTTSVFAQQQRLHSSSLAAPDEARLREHVTYLASEKLGGRRVGTEGADLAARYIAEQFKKVGLLPPEKKAANGFTDYLQSFPYQSNGERRDAYNVVGVLRGSDESLRNEFVVVGAHYDHLGLGGRGSLAARTGEVHHGADDNASGAAALIEIARLCRAEEGRVKRSLVFIAFGGEEEGLLGSSYYVNHPLVPLAQTAAMINLDMVGRLKNNRLIIGGTGTAEQWKTIIQNADGAPRFNLTLNEDGFGPSDHSSFYARQIPVLFFWTGTHEDYHKPSDTADKINYAGEAQIISFVRNILRAVDADAARPTYAKARNEHPTGGRVGGFRVYLGTIPSYAESTTGLVLDGVRDDSPASRAGLRAGDRVVRMAGRDVRNVYDYTYVLGEMRAGEVYEVEIIRA